MTVSPVIAARDADPDLLLDAADTILEVARYEGLKVLQAHGPRDGLAASLRAGFEPGHDVLLAVDPGRGVARALLHQQSNPGRAAVDVFVRPAARRTGVAGSLTATLAAGLAARGRTTVSLIASADTETDRLLAANPGLRPVQLQRESVWESSPATLDLARTARETALSHTGDYDLHAWVGPCPAEFVDGLGAALAAMDDAPKGDSSYESPPAGPEAVRQRDAYARDSGMRHHTVVAVHRGSGEVAGFTDAAMWPGHPQGEQWDTGVVHAHRGRRLGLLVKAEMALRLADLEPALHVLHTWNADDNEHMVAVNERLGWRLMNEWRLYEGPVTALAA